MELRGKDALEIALNGLGVATIAAVLMFGAIKGCQITHDPVVIQAEADAFVRKQEALSKYPSLKPVRVDE